MFKFEPSYASSLRRELDNLNLPIRLSKEQIVSIVASPDQSPAEYVEPVSVDEVEELKLNESYGLCHLRLSPHASPIYYKNDGFNIHVDVGPKHELLRDGWQLLDDLGPKFAPDMSIMTEGGNPVLAHTGTGFLFDLVARERNHHYDCYVISLGYANEEVLNALVTEHRKAGTPVTALVREQTGESVFGNPELVRSAGSVVLLDPRDIPEKLTNRRLISSNVYVVSTGALVAGVKWTYYRRRYHHANKIWYQLERDLCEITHQFLTNYVQL